ncbi:MAG: acetyl-CoA carboxylase biotin carboxyl carrier protein [Planctomycetes bacterium]|nr:acetyl-CoA carboxylase biotin carboxyl carrier protein [Planctomycetota bacterium]
MAKKANDTDTKKKSRGKSATSGAAEADSSTIKEVGELIELMVDNGLSELEIHEGRRKIVLKRGRGAEVVNHLAQATPESPKQVEAAPPPQEQIQEESTVITSPMVGTFYAAPGPDSEAYVAVGDSVGAEDIVCVVEAMKVMNEIKAGCAGTIAEVCVQNAQPVEFGQTLFRLSSP